jgi:alkanesulfonate monooxygenase SsuD/methylene tetrahydromethanopterin reductase-like flavin-dependent oxidoreductase (luciferase family)
VRFGYGIDTHGGEYDQPRPDRERNAAFVEQLLAETRATEAAGFDGAFVPERHARTETMWPQPMMLLLAMALATERVTLGPYVMQPGYYNPAHLAEMCALVDVASRGRLVLPVGTGYHPGYFSHFGIPYEQRLGRFLEAMAFMRRAWTDDEPFNFDGRYWQMKDVLVNPRPYAQPMPPVWYAATTEKPLRRAGRDADGVALLTMHTPLEDIRRSIDVYREAATEAGRKPVVTLHFDGFCGESHDDARDTFGRLWVEEVRYYLRWGMLEPTAEIPDVEHATFERLEKYMVLGDRQDCVDAINRIRDVLDLGDDDWIVLRSRLPFGPPAERVLESIERFGRDVIPAVGGVS